MGLGVSYERDTPVPPTAAEPRGDSFNGLKDFRLKHGSSHGQNLAVIVLCVPNWLDSFTHIDALRRPCLLLLLNYSQA